MLRLSSPQRRWATRIVVSGFIVFHGAVRTAPIDHRPKTAPASADASTSAIDEPFWGVAPSSALTHAPTSWLPEMRAAGVSTVRNFDPTTSADRLKPIFDAGMSATGILWWSSPSFPGTLPVQDLAGWRRYVADMVKRYKGRIHDWEVWNEPPNFTADQSPESYGAVVAAAYDAAKAIDPTIRIGLAAKSNHVNYLAQAIEGGAADKFDFITLHPYEVAGLLAEGWEGQFMSIVPRVRTMLRDKNAKKADVPVWFTEIGLQVASGAAAGVSPASQADGLVKIFTMSAAQRAARVYWFSPRDAEGEYLGLTASDSTKRPSYVALKTLTTYLGEHPTSMGWIQPSAGNYGFAFETPQGTVLVAWTRPGRSSDLLFSSPVTRIDPRTGTSIQGMRATLTDAPTLLLAARDSAQATEWRAAAATNVDRPFPWYGSHRASSTVSLDAATGPDGVYLVNAPPTTVVDGVAEFRSDGRGAWAFAVDPEFLSYTTRPIRITVTLRRTGTGDPGFNLKYESNAPLGKTDGNGLIAIKEGWHQIKETNAYQKSWIVQNTRFIGLYGYNFVFDSDGLSHSQFAIQKVLVSKL